MLLFPGIQRTAVAWNSHRNPKYVIHRQTNSQQKKVANETIAGSLSLCPMFVSRGCSRSQPRPLQFIVFVVPSSPLFRLEERIGATKCATSSSLRCAGRPSFVDGIAKRCVGTGGGKRNGVGETVRQKGWIEQERRRESQLLLVGRGWRKCGTSNFPGLSIHPSPS